MNEPTGPVTNSADFTFDPFEQATSRKGAGIPAIETERLILRPHRIEDFDAYAAFWADPEVIRFITGFPQRGKTAGDGCCGSTACGT